MARKKKTETKRPIESYEHRDKQRVNNPPVGLVTPDTDPDAGAKQIYAYDPHLDPQLVWAGKAEHTSFELPTVSLHVHERIDPRSIIEAVRKKNGNGQPVQGSLFEDARKEPLRQAVEFYKHAHGWSNRMMAGDSLLVMNSLLEKEGLASKVQMVYLDPPYGIRYGSNFQPFVNKRDVKDSKDEDLTAEPEQIRAFRDTWELGIHSYLTYLRDRLLVAREMLHESGSCFVQIGDENLHLVRNLMDDVFGVENFVVTIIAKKKGATTPTDPVNDHVVWFSKNRKELEKRVRRLYEDRDEPEDDPKFNTLISPEGKHIRVAGLSPSEIRKQLAANYRYARVNWPIVSQDPSDTRSKDFKWKSRSYSCGRNRHWTYDPETQMKKLAIADRLFDGGGESLGGVVYWNDWPHIARSNMWNDLHGEQQLVYVVQTNRKIVERCLLMTTDPGDLVFDPTCGSGTTAYVAEQWGRRWITCDTSRVALTLAKQRLMTAVFDYYELAHPQEGVGSGFKYKKVPRVTLKSIANNPDIREGMTREQIDAAIARHAPPETLYDQPLVDHKKHRVSGPFTVEAVPAPAVKSVGELLEGAPQPADASIARSGETLRQGEWRDELLRAGIRGKAGQHIRFARLEPLPGCRHLHADAETRPNDAGADRVREGGTASEAQRIVVAFGPEHAPLEQRQVAQATEEAQTLVPRPKLIVFAAFQFDPEAAKDIDETNWPGVTLLKAQMNADLFTDDLKKKRASNESFWLIGQPDVALRNIKRGEHQGKWEVEVYGFDYYNTKTGSIESGGAHEIAVWMLDTDYDGRSLYPRQVFFPLAGAKDGWARLAKSLKAQIDEELIEAYRGTVSLPFELCDHSRVAVKIVDNRGVESLKFIDVT